MKNLLLIFVLFFVFSTKAHAAVGPNLDHPTNNEAFIGTRLGISFYHIAGNNFYDIAYDTTNTFNSSVNLLQLGTIDNIAITNNTIISDTLENLYFDQRYYYKVRARTATDTTDWSETRTFVTRGAPFIIGSITVFDHQQFQLGHYMGANYVYELNDSPIFNAPIYISTIPGDKSRLPAQGVIWNSPSLLNSFTYYMRVKAFNEIDSSEWSFTYGFTTPEVFESNAINELNNGNLNIFPNPANTELYVANAKANSIFYLQDITGKIIYQQQLISSNSLIDMSNFESGIYITRITENDNVIRTEKLVISR